MKANIVRSLGCACRSVLLGGLTPDARASDAAQGTPGIGHAPGERPPDLTLQLPIVAGDYEFTRFSAAVPGFSLLGAKLDPDSSKTRLMVGVRFTSKSVHSARLKVTLLEDYRDSQKRMHTLTHIEAVGPDEVRKQGHNLDKVRKWDGSRALWFDLPKEARKATAFRVDVYLDEESGAGGDRKAEPGRGGD